MFTYQIISMTGFKIAEKNCSWWQKYFDAEHLVVQTEGLRRWLSVQRAINGGIFSNFKFSSPNNLIFDTLNMAEMKLPDVYSTNNIKWLILQYIKRRSSSKIFGHRWQHTIVGTTLDSSSWQQNSVTCLTNILSTDQTIFWIGIVTMTTK